MTFSCRIWEPPDNGRISRVRRPAQGDLGPVRALIAARRGLELKLSPESSLEPSAAFRSKCRSAALASRAFLRSSQVAVAIDQYIHREALGIEYRREVGVFHENYFGRSRRFFQELPDLLLRLADVYSVYHQALTAKFLADLSSAGISRLQ